MIYISIGSNLGDRLDNIKRAINLLKIEIFNDLQFTPILETQALMPKDAPPEWNKPFLNIIVCGKVSVSLEDLLEKLKEIEVKLGRSKLHEKWGPRIIDLDILLWDNVVINTASLVVPHPELCNRPFFVHMLALINPMLKYPNVISHRHRNKTFGEIAGSFPNITECYDKIFTFHPQLVGIVNVTPDSFSDGGEYFAYKKAIEHALELAEAGATVVELGAQSTRPSAKVIDADEEYDRLLPVLDGLLKEMKAGTIKISVDTFNIEVIRKILEYYPVSWINDVKGDLDNETLQKIAEQGCKIVVMHSLSVPVQKGEYLNEGKHPSDNVNKWAERIIERLCKCGFQKDSIIIDPGVGFGKSPYQNLVLIRNAKQMKKFGCPVLFGHSRKSYMTAFSKSPVIDRDLETIAISDCLNECEIDYLRVHNVRDHQRFFIAKQLIYGS